LSAAKRIPNYDNRSKAKELMRNDESNLKRKSKSANLPQQQPGKTPNPADDPNVFTDSITKKPDRIELESLLPFLEERVAFNMPSDIKYLDGVLDYLNEWMLKQGVLKPGDTELLIALDEAIVNAIKHGNKCDPRKAVHIIAECCEEGARFTVADEGPGFEREKVPDPTDPCRLLEPNGRGLLLINHIMDEVCYNQAGNRLEMFKRAERDSQQASATEDPTENNA
jgi:serine/threonine-protein kinase RsbW